MKRLKSGLVIFLIPFYLLLPAAAHAWWGTGHIVTAMIAYEDLTPKAKEATGALMAELAKYWPNNMDLPTISTWPDDIKAEGIGAFSAWHYTNIPYNPDNVSVGPQPEVNVVWAIEQSVNVLLSPKANPMMKAQFLAFLVHFVGDIHQPLHCASHYSHEQTQGDMGGNNFVINDTTHGYKLHSLWDDGCGLFPKIEQSGPLKDDDRKALQSIADKCRADFPREKFLLPELKAGPKSKPQAAADLWSRESYRLAQKAYQGVKEGEIPNQGYLDWGRKICMERLAAGGYRLANLLNAIFI